ncbi:MAG: hypothetical protein KKA62_01135 [Nanoarchaeota archaeon]|nr:hypothetical protein [Nanoarchaeota archaeon]MBU1643964.1 hypothetical protein [Nanoarchaeota archaeon]MBU1976539.1 hypothetical protein [Nanoarchaeota archaeon]
MLLYPKLKFEELKKKHLSLQAKSAGVGNKLNLIPGFVKEIKEFVREIGLFLRVNKSSLKPKQRASLVVIRDYWLRKTKHYST